MSVKKTTFKQRIRRNDLRQRNDISRDLKKRMRVTNRSSNRYDAAPQSGSSMEELVEQTRQGAAIAARDADLDPRALANLLATRDPESGKQKLVNSLDPSHPGALPDPDLTQDDALKTAAVDNQGNNKNRYKHRGSPYVFWDRIGLHPLLLEALKTMKFTHPTPVQEEVLPTVLNFDPSHASGSKRERAAAMKSGPQLLKNDVVVSAETGSGKTLVFALPILHHILLEMEAAAQQDAESAEEASTAVAGTKKEDKQSTKEKKSKKRRTEGEQEAADEAAAKAGAAAIEKTRTTTSSRIMHSLVVSPTRELALQIKECFEQLTVHARQIRIGCVVGGMAPEKQQRVLNRAPHVLICTPGRLWDLLQHNEGCYLGHSISRRLRFVILDEADKLLQGGRFEELKKILERVHCDVLPAGFGQRQQDTNDNETLVEPAEGDDAEDGAMEAGRWDEGKQKFVPFTKEEKEAIKKAGGKKAREVALNKSGFQQVGKDRPKPIPMPPAPSDDHRTTTFVTSATLSLQTNYTRRDLKANKSIIRTSNANTMAAVLTELCIKERTAHIFNMSPEAGVVSKINETFLRCPEKSKDLYLYYFLRTYKERTIVFVNAISMLRRLTHLLEVLGIPVVGLHASMQQRQRLKFIEKFKSGEKRVLVATDIASRGIDIEGLRYVLHYQVPRSTDAYIHRCGRTARCGGTGLSVLMVNASEYVSFKKLLGSLGRAENSMETFSLEPSVVHHLHPHMLLAMQIDKLQREIGKSEAGARWVNRMSNDAEVDADDMIDSDALKENREKHKAINVLKKQLNAMIKKEMGHHGGKGGFRSGARALGNLEATQRLRQRADRQVIAGAKF